MSLRLAVKTIQENLQLNDTEAGKIYKSFWDFIEDTLTKDGSVSISGIGKFYLEEKKDTKKPEFSVKFDAAVSLLDVVTGGKK